MDNHKDSITGLIQRLNICCKVEQVSFCVLDISETNYIALINGFKLILRQPDPLEFEILLQGLFQPCNSVQAHS